MISLIYEKNQKIKLVLSVFLLLIYCVGITLSGGNVAELLMFWSAALFFIGFSGYALYKSLLLENYISKFEIPIVFVLGCSYFLLCFCLGIGLNILLFYFPSIVLSCYGFYLFIKNKCFKLNFNKAQKIQGNFLFLIICALIFVYTFAGVAKFAHPAQVGQIVLSQDFMWNVGNAESFKLAFPPEDIRFFGVQLQYHYFTEILVSAFSTITGISSYNILAFYSQSLFLAVLIITLYQFASAILNSKFKANFFTISVFALSCLSLHKILPNGASVFSNSLISATLTNINSMSNAFCFTAVFTLLFFNAYNKNFRVNFGYYLTMLFSFVLLCFTKSPIAAILAIALIAVLFARFIQGKFKPSEIIFVLSFASFFAVIYYFNFSAGAQTSTGFSLDYTLKSGYFKNILYRLEIEMPSIYIFTLPVFMLIQSVCIAPFTLPIFALSGVKKLFNFKSLDFPQLFGYAVGVGGFVAFFVSYHEAFSQVYFLYIALFFITLIAVKEFKFDKINIKNAPFYLLLIASVATSVFLYVNLLGSGLRQYLFHYDILPKYPYEYIVKSEDELAGEYLRSVQIEDDMFATNRTHSGYKEGLSNVYSAFSGMQGYMEGFKYAISNMGVSWDIVEQRIAVNDALFNAQTSVDEIKTLCEENGITYLVYSSQFEGSSEQLEALPLVFEDGTVKIYKVS